MTPAPDDLRTAYGNHVVVGRGPSVAEIERALMVDTFLAVGSDAPTLSGDWTTRHLIAHLVLRESNPVGSIKAAVAKLGDEVVDDLVASTAFEELVEQFGDGPPALSFFRLPGNDRRLNALEHFIHHEDVRRAQPSWTRRELPRWAQTQLWAPLRWFAKGIVRHAPVAVTLRRTDAPDESVARKGDDPVVVTGLPSELCLYIYGRQGVADYELEGDPDSVERLRRKRFRL
jgi:uncharacterized protein (TIGR03085 family)